MTRRVDAYRGLSQPSRLRIMHELLVTPGQSLADLAAVTGLHENTLRDHLHVLESEGFVVRRTEHRGTRGRPRDIFDPSGPDTPSPVAARRVEDAKRHGDLLRKVMMHTTATDETVAHQLDALYEHLDDVGLDPQMDETTLTVDLAPCAFHDLVDDQLTMLCHVHAELIRGVLHQAGGPLEVDQLLPLVTAHHCHLALKILPSGAEDRLAADARSRVTTGDGALVIRRQGYREGAGICTVVPRARRHFGA